MRQLILFIGLALLLGSCAKNIAPTCIITTPSNNAEIEKGTTVTISADVEDEDGNLSEVRFYIDNAGVSSSSSFPYSYSWSTSDVTTGDHTIKATAIDEEGEESSDNISVTITTGGSSGNVSCPLSVSDINGNSYNVVQIGNQCWMAENLKATKYPNGSNIPLVTDNTAWADLADNGTDDAYCYYNNNTSGEANTYGALYTWAAAMGDNAVGSSSNPSGVQGVCPSGWHLPSDAEWTELEDYLIANGYNYDGSTSRDKTGKSLASTSGWTSSSSTGDVGNDQSSNNSTGFSGLPGGRRFASNGSFDGLYYYGGWCSATEYSSMNAWKRTLGCNSADLNGGTCLKSVGLSVRCVKDN